MGLIVSTFSYIFVWLSFRDLLLNAVARVLSTGQISVAKSFTSEAPQIVVKLLDGSDLNLVLTWQRSGLISITVFGLLFLLLIFPLEGSIRLKTAWLELGFIIGLTWSFIRLSITIVVAYHFGAGAFAIAEFFVGPFTDFFWMVSVWALVLSALVKSRIDRRVK